MTQPTDRILRHGSLADLTRRARRHARLLAQVRAALPDDLAAVTHVGAFEGPVLTLVVPGAAWSTRLRFEVDRLQAALGTLGDFVLLRRIDVRVAPEACAEPAGRTLRPHRATAPWVGASVASIAEGVDDARLRAALQSLARRLAGNGPGAGPH